ncbi:hypothetical protein KKH27_10315 [bacterium]|nr:hypothetical protein [bacterium]MBU1984327.1 hypothetical protein [bacterium]
MVVSRLEDSWWCLAKEIPGRAVGWSGWDDYPPIHAAWTFERKLLPYRSEPPTV